MCGHSKSQAKVLERRQNGLDSRGNVPAHTRAESNWAVDTLKTMDPATTQALGDDLLKLYDKAAAVKGKINRACVGKFKDGVDEIFGPNRDRTPTSEQLMALMLEGRYNFKGATDAINREQKEDDGALYKTGRSGREFAGEKGRIAGRERSNSFKNLDAGITDRVNRDDESRDFFSTRTVHAKGQLEGDSGTDIYQEFQDSGAPFIGGASGTMQGLVMGMQMEDPAPGAVLKAQREKLIGVYMATLAAGGHHSVSECLIAAKKYGYFENVGDPLADYADAMDQLGKRLTAIGLPTDLTPQDTAVGAPWRKALLRLNAEIGALRAAVQKEYADRNRATAGVLKSFDDSIGTPLKRLFPDELAGMLDDLPGTKDDKVARARLLDEARAEIADLRSAAKSGLVTDAEKNPFRAVSIRAPLTGALDLIAKEIVGPA